jgi:uncharacterized tellurite resistance protein B-like protein
MLFRWFKRADETVEHPAASELLHESLRSAMPHADEDTLAVVSAVAGLLAYVAFADRAYREEEQLAVSDALARMHGVGREAVAGISSLLTSRFAELTAEPLHDYTRVLVALTGRSARLELLDVLLDLAAADLVLSMDETNLLRRIARLLGLSDHEYLASQTRHRDRLSVLTK